MKRTLITLSLLAAIAAPSAIANDIVNITPVVPTVNEDGKQVIVMPDKKKIKRRKMLFEFGAFGMGVHVGWLRPRNAECVMPNGRVFHRGHGWPIFNVSAGQHALGLGTR